MKRPNDFKEINDKKQNESHSNTHSTPAYTPGLYIAPKSEPIGIPKIVGTFEEDLVRICLRASASEDLRNDTSSHRPVIPIFSNCDDSDEEIEENYTIIGDDKDVLKPFEKTRSYSALSIIKQKCVETTPSVSQQSIDIFSNMEISSSETQLNYELSKPYFQATVRVSNFGQLILSSGSVPVEKYTLSNSYLEVDIITFGSTITNIKMPDRNGKWDDIVLGFDNIEAYVDSSNPYMGATVGRITNRTGQGRYYEKLHDHDQKPVPVYLSRNCGPHHLHGGIIGIDKKLWAAEIMESGLKMRCINHHNEEGYSGDVYIEVIYRLQGKELSLHISAIPLERPTPINITNHSYFNLAGHEKGPKEIYEHYACINANFFTPLEGEWLLCQGEIKPLVGTPYNLAVPKRLGEQLEKMRGVHEGFDVNYCINGLGHRPAAFAFHEKSGRCMIIETNQPGLQFYSANFLDNLKGKSGAIYNKHGAICFEPQAYPNAANIKQPNFPDIVFVPGQKYQNTISFTFFVDTNSTFLKMSPSDNPDSLRCHSSFSTLARSLSQTGDMSEENKTINKKLAEICFCVKDACILSSTTLDSQSSSVYSFGSVPDDVHQSLEYSDERTSEECSEINPAQLHSPTSHEGSYRRIISNEGYSVSPSEYESISDDNLGCAYRDMEAVQTFVAYMSYEVRRKLRETRRKDSERGGNGDDTRVETEEFGL